jgi:hypothetical protein
MRMILGFLFVISPMLVACDIAETRKYDSSKFSEPKELIISSYPYIKRDGTSFFIKQKPNRLIVSFFSEKTICFDKNSLYFTPSLDLSYYFKDESTRKIDLIIERKSNNIQYNNIVGRNCFFGGGEIEINLDIMKIIRINNEKYIGYITINYVNLSKQNDVSLKHHNISTLNIQLKPDI